METIIGAIALALAVPALAQSAPAADQSHCQAAQVRQKHESSNEGMLKSCPDMMKLHAKMGRKAKTEAERIDAEVNGNGHQGHNH